MSNQEAFNIPERGGGAEVKKSGKETYQLVSEKELYDMMVGKRYFVQKPDRNITDQISEIYRELENEE